VLGNLVCLGRHTLTGLICASGNALYDWTSDYRVYQSERVDMDAVFRVIAHQIFQKGHKEQPVVCALDDTTLRKTGKRIPGVKYTRDPMGPPFSVNFVRGQRVIQLSAAISDDSQAARMIPVLFKDAPSANKPKKNAGETDWENYKEQRRQQNLSRYGVACLTEMRARLNTCQPSRPLWVTVDGSYTNSTVLRNLPKGVTLIGRIRADAKLFYPVTSSANGCGRKRIYGAQAPTPEEARQDESIPWQSVKAYASGKEHEFRVKVVDALRWRASGDAHLLKVIVIAPLRYRLTKSSPLLYRKPAYLICTDPDADIQKILQAYLWRWGIEVNFRDEKTLLGLGQAQVRNTSSVAKVPQMMVAAYALMLIAAANCYGIDTAPQTISPPKWQRKKRETKRPATMDLIRAIRMELWADAIKGKNKNDFEKRKKTDAKCYKCLIPLHEALFRAAA
jgi:hypothetical protein